MILHDSFDINEKGRLTIAGYDAEELALQFGTPAFFIDEMKIRSACREYRASFTEFFGGDSQPVYAGKALCFSALYRIMREEGMAADCVSSGEIATALKAGFPMEKVFFHGNNKTDEDIRYAISSGVGFFVADGEEELLAINREAGAAGIRQKILLRITPGIDPHTHKKIITGNVDSKFGSAISTGRASEITALALSLDNVELSGFHCHVGSQIFEPDPFCDAAVIMMRFIAEMKKEYGYSGTILNLGGGFGVRYTEDDPKISYRDNIRAISEVIKDSAKRYLIETPTILMEPGRSIVAAAGATLYSVGSVKEIPGFRNYVSIDGGMTDNPRYTLYGSKYTVVNASRASLHADFEITLAGRCCESGDLIAEGVRIARPERGDIIAVLVTGAYNYSMASNYNRVPRPPVILIGRDGPRVAVRREKLEDITSLDE